jgi:uncharacterized membrane protein YeaQ/YmgE (transglycosylase-associated protein family)
LFIGGLSGWLAGLIMKTSYGIVINIILGMTGGLIGGWLLSLVNIGTNGLIMTIIGSVLGAVILIFISSRLCRSRNWRAKELKRPSRLWKSKH